MFYPLFVESYEVSSQEEAEMVESVENAFRQMDITLANQLSLAYPKENTRILC